MAKLLVSAGLSLALFLGASSLPYAALSETGLQQVHAESSVTRQSIHDGAILHAFCWNFNTIKENMDDIAAAGYTAVQTSPINECLSTEPGLTLFSDEGKWYYHYQPTDWVIGNYQLGTRDEFKEMCDEAEKYGIGVIVDIDPNHTTPSYDQIGDGLLDAVGGLDNLYHKNGGGKEAINYSDRVSVVYDAMGGLPDVDTENEAFQNYFYQFLKDCVDCGADGFRIDTAKHIALPDDGVPSEYEGEEDRNTFYTNMAKYLNENGAKQYGDLFVYGEVLQGDTDRLAAYQQYIGGTTASDYGGAIRTAISSGSLAVKKIEGYRISDETKNDVTYTADSNKLVTWVESHDNYINDGSYKTVDDTDVILAWAIITAREDGTPLFFSRPDGSSKDNYWGNNVLGAAGSDIYKDPQVVAVNKFRTAMVGQEEFLRNPSGNNSVLMIERGDRGVVIVNATEAPFDLESETNLKNGNYKDSVEGHNGLYTVENGVITGKVPAQSVVVLDKQADGDYSTLFFFNSKEWGQVSATVDGTDYTCDNTGDGWWKVTIPKAEFEIVFSNGDEKSSKFNISKASGRYMTAENGKLYSSKEAAEDDLGVVTKSVYFFNTQEWNTVYSYGWYDGGQQIFGGWPGLPAKNIGGYWWRADVKQMADKSFYIIFSNNNGSQTSDIDMSDMSKPYIALVDGKVERFETSEEASEATGVYPDKTTVHFYNTKGWDEVAVYTWGATSLGEWPGKLAEQEDGNWWKLTINSAPGSDFNIIFNNNGNDQQTGDLVVDSISNVYFWGNQKYNSKAAAEKAEYDYSHQEDEEVEQKEGYTVVYFYNEPQWESPYVYVWGGDYNDAAGTWPGTKMTKVDGNWYAANVKTEALECGALNLIFNNDGDSGTQTPNVPVADTSKLYFTYTSTDSFESKSEVYDFLGIEEPSEPEEPEQPSQPEEPSQPSQPSQPTQPTYPASQESSSSGSSNGGSSSSSSSYSAPIAAVANNDIVAAAPQPQQEEQVEKKAETKKVTAKAEVKTDDEEVEESEEAVVEETEAIEATGEVVENSEETTKENDIEVAAEGEVLTTEEEKSSPVVPVAAAAAVVAVALGGYVAFKRRKIG